MSGRNPHSIDSFASHAIVSANSANRSALSGQSRPSGPTYGLPLRAKNSGQPTNQTCWPCAAVVSLISML